MAEQTPLTPAPASTPAVPAPTPSPTPAATPAAVAPAKPGSKAWVIVLVVILALILVCCGGSVLAWFIARQTVIDWADSVGVSLEKYADEIENANNDADNDAEDDEDDDDADGSDCITEDGEDGIWYIANDSDDDGKIDADECEADEVEPETGFVTGTIMFPSEFYPDDLEVCAEDSTTGDLVDCVSYTIGEYSGLAEYELELPEGDYYVYSQTATGGNSGYKAYYSEFVECGYDVSCTNHDPIEVTVTAGDTEHGVDPGDWYVL